MVIFKSGLTPSKWGLVFLSVIAWILWRFSLRVHETVNPWLKPITEFRESIVSQYRAQPRGNSAEIFSPSWKRDLDDLQFTNLITRITFHRPEGLEKYFAYDAGAKQALFDLTNMLYEQKAPIPVFRDRFADVAPAVANPKLCVGIMSARRQTGPISYLVQTVTSLLTRIDLAAAEHRNDVYMHVFNADHVPESHWEVNLIHHLLPVSNLKYASRFSGVSPKLQAGLDWVEATRELRRVGCKYALMLEDDVIADENWLEHVLRGIDQIENRGDPDWFVVKFYTARHWYPTAPLRGVNDYNQGFNAVALVINPKRVDHFAQSLVEYTLSYLEQGGPVDEFDFIDLFIEKYAISHSLDVKCYEPVAFQHAGIYSAVNTRSLDHRGARLWYMSSRFFQSEGKIIHLDSDRVHIL